MRIGMVSKHKINLFHMCVYNLCSLEIFLVFLFFDNFIHK